MTKLAAIFRLLSLSVLSAGSAAIVFAAVIQVKQGLLQGETAQQAAALNAPVFVAFSKVALGAAIVLGMAEILHYCRFRQFSCIRLVRYLTSALCISAILIFSLYLVPNLEHLRPHIYNSPSDLAAFTKLHHLSRAIFGFSILSALLSLLIPIAETE